MPTTRFGEAGVYTPVHYDGAFNVRRAGSHSSTKCVCVWVGGGGRGVTALSASAPLSPAYLTSVCLRACLCLPVPEIHQHQHPHQHQHRHQHRHQHQHQRSNGDEPQRPSCFVNSRVPPRPCRSSCRYTAASASHSSRPTTRRVAQPTAPLPQCAQIRLCTSSIPS